MPRREEDYDDEDDEVEERITQKPKRRRDDDDDEDDEEEDRGRRRSSRGSGGLISEGMVPHLTWVCQGAFWLSYSPNLLYIMTADTKAMNWICSIAAIVLGGATLAFSILALMTCA